MLFFIKKIEHHPSNRVPYFVYLPGFLLSNRHKVLNKEHSNNFHQSLFKLGCLGLHFCFFKKKNYFLNNGIHE